MALPRLKQSKNGRIKLIISALAGVAQCIEDWPVDQNVAGLIPGQGTCLGCRPGPKWGCTGGNQPRQPIHVSLVDQCFSPFLSPSFPFSLKISK